MGMSEFIYFAICFAALALCLIYRLIRGPHSADRVVAADAIDYKEPFEILVQ